MKDSNRLNWYNGCHGHNLQPFWMTIDEYKKKAVYPFHKSWYLLVATPDFVISSIAVEPQLVIVLSPDKHHILVQFFQCPYRDKATTCSFLPTLSFGTFQDDLCEAHEAVLVWEVEGLYLSFPRGHTLAPLKAQFFLFQCLVLYMTWPPIQRELPYSAEHRIFVCALSNVICCHRQIFHYWEIEDSTFLGSAISDFTSLPWQCICICMICRLAILYFIVVGH